MVPSRRHEVKASASPTDLPVLRTWLDLHWAGFRVAYPERIVNSLYFDTEDLRCWEENLAGQSERTKVRYRWYGASRTPVAGVLELKRRANQLGWKESQAIGDPPFCDGDDWRTFHRRLLAVARPELRVVLEQHACATLLMRYRREYFVSHGDRIRLTIDHDLEAFDQRASPRPNWTRASNLPPVVVLELKCDEHERELAGRVLGDCPVRLSRFSKYAIALQNG